MKNKKAQGYLVALKLIDSLKLILLILFGIGLFIFLLSPKSIDAGTEKDLQKTMYLRGITGTPGCMAYEEVGGRVDQRIVDHDKLTKTTLSSCLGAPKNRDFSDWHSAQLYLKERNQYINSSNWVYPLMFEYVQTPIIIRNGEEIEEDIAILYMQLQ